MCKHRYLRLRLKKWQHLEVMQWNTANLAVSRNSSFIDTFLSQSTVRIINFVFITAVDSAVKTKLRSNQVGKTFRQTVLEMDLEIVFSTSRGRRHPVTNGFLPNLVIFQRVSLRLTNTQGERNHSSPTVRSFLFQEYPFSLNKVRPSR